MAAFQTGAADLASIAFYQVGTLREANPELNLAIYDTSRSNYYYCNQNPEHSPLFVDVRVRQAMMYALDRQLIAETVYQGFATPTIGTQPPLSIAYQPDEIRTPYEFDPERAKGLMDEAGWVAGADGIREKDGVRFSFETIYNDTSDTFAQQIPYMQQAWRDIGIEMKPQSKPFPTVVDAVIAGDFEMALSSFGWNVDGGQGVMFRCDATPPDGFNRMRYCNPRYDELDDLQLRELDAGKRIALLTEQTNIVNDDAAAGILLFQQRISGYSPRVHNYFPNGFNSGWSLPRVWLEE
jgi:peptide/nickel transport system substrate-binding protein